MAQRKNTEGAYPQAHPTAPGGMSMAAIRVELVESFGYKMADLREVKWPVLIDMLGKERQARDIAASDEPVTQPKGKPVRTQPAPVIEPDPVDEDDDPLAFDPDLDDLDEDDETISLDDAYDSLTPEEHEAAEGVFTEDLSDYAEEFLAQDHETPEPEYHEDGTEHDQIECHHSEHDDPTCMCGVEESRHWMVEDHAFFDAETRTYAETIDGQDPEDLLAEIEASQPAPIFIGLPGVRDYIFDGHMGAGPSAAERWMNCTASLGATREFLETLTRNQQEQLAGAGQAARQGTTAHAAAESELSLMLGRITPEEHEVTLTELTITPPVAEEAYDTDMAEAVEMYADFIRPYVDAGHEILVEERVSAVIPLTVEDYVPTVDGEAAEYLRGHYVVTGSTDAGILPTPQHNVLTVVDYKHGDGIDVDVDSNPQIRIYGIGLLANLADEEGNLPNLDRVEYAIIQPRLGGVKMWSESVEDLLAWRDEALSPALTSALGLDDKAEFAPSDLACQWCDVRGSCPALTTQRVEAAAEAFDVVVETEFDGGSILDGLPNAHLLGNDKLGRLLTQVSNLVKMKDDLKEEVQRRMYRGEKVPGHVLVNYTPKGDWKAGADEAIRELDLTSKQIEAAFKPIELRTPKQVQTLLGKEEADKVEHLIVRPDKRPVVAPEGDRRSLWTGGAPEEMFVNEDAPESVAYTALDMFTNEDA